MAAPVSVDVRRHEELALQHAAINRGSDQCTKAHATVEQ
jgi:hypothetical protein